MVVACQYLGVLPINTSSYNSSLQDSVQKAPKLVLADDDDDDTQDIHQAELEQTEEESEHDSIQLDSIRTYEKNERRNPRRRRNLDSRDDDGMTLEQDNKDIFPSGVANLFDNILQAAAEEENDLAHINNSNKHPSPSLLETNSASVATTATTTKAADTTATKNVKEEEVNVTKGRYSSTRSRRK